MAPLFICGVACRTLLGLSPSFLSFNPRLPAIATARLYSSSQAEAFHATDEHMSRVLQAEMITHEKESNMENTVLEDIPFTIMDNFGKETITLKRNVFGQDIEVEVGQDYSLSIMMDKGKDTYLEFHCKLGVERVTFSGINPNSHKVLYVLRKCEGFDEKKSLEGATEKYLKDRGIDGSIGNVLEEQLRVKRHRDSYFKWLKNIDDFVTKPSSFLE